MTGNHQHLALAQVKPGMILSDELLDAQGQVLLPQGALLTAAIIALLPRHGIESLAVGSDAPGAEAAPDPAVVLARLDRLFRKNDIGNHGDWATGLLRRYMQDYRLDREAEA